MLIAYTYVTKVSTWQNWSFSFRVTHYVILNVVVLFYESNGKKTYHHSKGKTHTKWRSIRRNAWREM